MQQYLIERRKLTWPQDGYGIEKRNTEAKTEENSEENHFETKN